MAKREPPHSVCVTVQEKDCRLTDGVIFLSPSLISLTLENFISSKNVSLCVCVCVREREREGERERIRMNMYLIIKDKFL